MEKFAKLCGLSKGYISMLERGVNPKSGKPIIPSIDTVAQIASIMKISVDELLKMAENSGDTNGKVKSSTIEVNETSEAYKYEAQETEECLAYYDGNNFVPLDDVSIPKNQPVLVTIIEEKKMTSNEKALFAIKKLRGIMAGTGMSSEAFAARKKYEKELER